MSGEGKGLLFLCVANSSRSQMAEGFVRNLAPNLEVYSAGSNPTQLNPYAVQVMREIEVDISSHHAKSIDDVPKDRIGTVITLCAEEICPVFPGSVERIHWPLADPARTTGPEDAMVAAFRSVRDQIKARIEQSLQKSGGVR